MSGTGCGIIDINNDDKSLAPFTIFLNSNIKLYNYTRIEKICLYCIKCEMDYIIAACH